MYGSCVPRIMREFVDMYMDELKAKKLIIFFTQMMFSGDGARAFARLIPNCEKRVLYAEHFSMPNNICNYPLFPMTEKERVIKPQKAIKRLDEICSDIQNGVIKKRGWNVFYSILGKSQNIIYPMIEEKAKHSFYADESCTKCGLCVKICPMNNLEIVNDQVV
ncbi:MAG: EFR1 family ferrodoxin [Erysipelotrichaceae bacterium]|nr:EFR1 family ferrodoxin [Erysipelotrichaceae bacterium]